MLKQSLYYIIYIKKSRYYTGAVSSHVEAGLLAAVVLWRLFWTKIYLEKIIMHMLVCPTTIFHDYFPSTCMSGKTDVARENN